MKTILDLQPAIVWKYFYEITQVPRPSKKEGKIIRYLENFADQHHLPLKKDAVGNILRITSILLLIVILFFFKNNAKGYDKTKNKVTKPSRDSGAGGSAAKKRSVRLTAPTATLSERVAPPGEAPNTNSVLPPPVSNTAKGPPSQL